MIKPWDVVINEWASLDNPTRIGIVISVSRKYAGLTNVKGDTWKSQVEILRVVGSIAPDVGQGMDRVLAQTL